jgi:hypothetical protein
MIHTADANVTNVAMMPTMMNIGDHGNSMPSV